MATVSIPHELAMNIPRKLLPADDYLAFIKARYYTDMSIRGTAVEEEIYETFTALAHELCRQIEKQGLSCEDDIYIAFDYCGTKVVGANFVGDKLGIAEEIIYGALQNERWRDYAVLISPGRREPMPLGIDEELITAEGIFAQTPEA